MVGNKLSMRFENIKFLDGNQLKAKSNLTHIDLRNNKLCRLPDQISDLILLRELKLDYNFLSKLPFGLFRLMHLQMTMAIAMDNSTGGNHFGIKHRMRTDKAQEIATVAISPVHHGGDAEFSIHLFG